MPIPRISSRLDTFLLNSALVYPCASIPCRNNGTCVQTGWTADNYTCQCLPDYSGQNCEIGMNILQSLTSSLCVVWLFNPMAAVGDISRPPARVLEADFSAREFD
jgi:hypothetical protein